MKKLAFLYNMSLEFSQPAEKHHFKLKCLPRTSDRQVIDDLSFEIVPNTEISCGTDGFGNLTRYGSVICAHTRFEVTVKGVCTLNGGFVGDPINPSNLGLFKVQTPLTVPGGALTEFFHKLILPEGTNLEKAQGIMHEVYNYFEYTPKATYASTSAEQAFCMKKGVCQDYSQSMLSICRALNIPCRYVAGLLMGEGETHAWVEVESDGRWYGFDPTNNVEVSDSHIVVATGRDSADCSINRGIFCGGGTQSQKIYVKVEEVNDTNSNAGGTAVR